MGLETQPARTSVREKVSLLAAMVIGAGFAKLFNTQHGSLLGWRRPRNTTWRSNPERIALAAAKRAQRAAKVRHHVAMGAYGLRPLVGQKGYEPNYPIASASA